MGEGVDDDNEHGTASTTEKNIKSGAWERGPMKGKDDMGQEGEEKRLSMSEGIDREGTCTIRLKTQVNY
ncbi:hypothetical protein F4774DRAFT_407044 [Daldinia eschscholtzii]|nr:hypothetical protein F4774DRAFT_407044 [Daldinia eschscholtzii]